MKKRDIEAGKVYWAKVSGTVQKIRIDSESPHGGWLATNLATGRRIRVKGAQRLRAQAQEGGMIGLRMMLP